MGPASKFPLGDSAYCDGVEVKLRSRSGEGHAVNMTMTTAGAEGDPLWADAVARSWLDLLIRYGYEYFLGSAFIESCSPSDISHTQAPIHPYSELSTDLLTYLIAQTPRFSPPVLARLYYWP